MPPKRDRFCSSSRRFVLQLLTMRECVYDGVFCGGGVCVCVCCVCVVCVCVAVHSSAVSGRPGQESSRDTTARERSSEIEKGRNLLRDF